MYHLLCPVLILFISLVQGVRFEDLEKNPEFILSSNTLNNEVLVENVNGCTNTERPALVPGVCDYLENVFDVQSGCITQFVCKVCPDVVAPKNKFGCRWIYGREQDTGCPNFVERCGGEFCVELEKPHGCQWDQVKAVYDNHSGCVVEYKCIQNDVPNNGVIAESVAFSTDEVEVQNSPGVGVQSADRRCPSANLGCVVGDSPGTYTDRVDCTQTGTVACRSVGSDYCGAFVGFPPKRFCCLRAFMQRPVINDGTKNPTGCPSENSGCIIADHVHGADCTFAGDNTCQAAGSTYCGAYFGIPARRVCCTVNVNTVQVPIIVPNKEKCPVVNSGCVTGDTAMNTECTGVGHGVCERVLTGSYCGAPYTNSERRVCCVPGVPPGQAVTDTRSVVDVSRTCPSTNDGCIFSHLSIATDCTVAGSSVCIQNGAHYCGAFLSSPTRRVCCQVPNAVSNRAVPISIIERSPITTDLPDVSIGEQTCPPENGGCIFSDTVFKQQVDCTVDGSRVCTSVGADYCGASIGSPARRLCCTANNIQRPAVSPVAGCPIENNGCIFSDEPLDVRCEQVGDSVCQTSGGQYCGAVHARDNRRVCCKTRVNPPINNVIFKNRCPASNQGCIFDQKAVVPMIRCDSNNDCNVNGQQVGICGAVFSFPPRRVCCGMVQQTQPRNEIVDPVRSCQNSGCMFSHSVEGTDCTDGGSATCRSVGATYCSAFSTEVPSRRVCCLVPKINTFVNQLGQLIGPEVQQRTGLTLDDVTRVIREIVSELIGGEPKTAKPILQDSWQVGNLESSARPRRITIRDESNRCPSVCVAPITRDGCSYKFGTDSIGCQTVELVCDKMPAAAYDEPETRTFSPKCPALRLPTLPHSDCVYEYVRDHSSGCVMAVGFECPRENRRSLIPAVDVDPSLITISQEIDDIDIEMQTDSSRVTVRGSNKEEILCIDARRPSLNEHCDWIPVVNDLDCIVDYQCAPKDVRRASQNQIRIPSKNLLVPAPVKRSSQCPDVIRPILPTDRTCRLKYTRDVNNCVSVDVVCNEVSTPNSIRDNCKTLVRPTLPHSKCRHVFGVDVTRCPIVTVICDGLVIANDQSKRIVCPLVDRPPLPGNRCRHVISNDINGCEAVEIVCDCESVTLMPLRGANCFHVYTTDGNTGCPIVSEECACPPTRLPQVTSNNCKIEHITDQVTGCAVVQMRCGTELCEPFETVVTPVDASNKCQTKIVTTPNGCPVRVETCQKEPIISAWDNGVDNLVDNMVSVRDSNGYCCFWGSIGECDANPIYMRSKCQRSCGTVRCSAENALNCKVFTDVEGCPWNPHGQSQIVIPNKISNMTNTGCRNNHSLCGVWAQSGDCQTKPVFMEKMCKLACGLCTLQTTFNNV